MKWKHGFCRIDFVACVLCVGFLLAALGAVGSRGRRKAKEVVCLSNLRQWGAAIEAYTEDNDEYFHEGYSGGGGSWSGYWMFVLEDYCGDEDVLRCCPEATKPISEGGRNPFAAWGIYGGWPYDPDPIYGSYGSNSYATNPQTDYMWGITTKYNWRSPNVSCASEVPVLAGCQWFWGFPEHSDEPPEYESQSIFDMSSMGRFCQNRHAGYVSGVFADFSARKIGLKELWELKWHRNWYRGVENPPDAEPDYCPPDWPEWMEDFEDYGSCER